MISKLIQFIPIIRMRSLFDESRLCWAWRRLIGINVTLRKVGDLIRGKNLEEDIFCLYSLRGEEENEIEQ